MPELHPIVLDYQDLSIDQNPGGTLKAQVYQIAHPELLDTVIKDFTPGSKVIFLGTLY